MTKPSLLALYTLLLCLFAALGPAPAEEEKPNVLLLLVDDLKPAIAAYGDETAKTPHLDKLVARGMRFERAYCNQAVCAPSRFTLMLGAHSTSTGLYGLGSPLREIMPDAVTMPQHFAKHGGYRTESLGKVYHIGHGNHGDSESFSVPHFKEKVIEYVDPESKPGGKLTREEAMFQNVPAPEGGMNMLPRGAAWESPDVADDAYADGRVAAETVKRLRAAKERRAQDGTPFFITAGFARPHLPFSAPKKYWDLYDPDALPMPEFEDLPEDSPAAAGKRGGEIRNYFPVPDKNDPAEISDEVKRELIHGYYASVSYVDAQIGKVMDGLDELGLADNTIVVLWGDHGFHLGDLGIWTKHTNYEQANRIPLVFIAPGVTEAGAATRQLAESVDVFPTLAELAGLPAPKGPQPIDGVSLVPVLKDAEARVRDHAFHAYPKGKLGRAIRTGRFRLVEWKQPGAPRNSAEIELYDYQEDPLETRNLASEKPAAVKRLRAILDTYPEAVPRGGKKGGGGKAKGNAAAASSPPASGVSPKIAKQSLRIIAETNNKKKDPAPQGVVLAQGGNQHGYAVHFLPGGIPAFDVRVNGKVTRIAGETKVGGEVSLVATLDAEVMTLSHNGTEIARAKSPGLIPSQPLDALSIGQDILSAAGDYEAPNPFNNMIWNTRVEAGGKPPEIDGPMSREEIEAGFAAHDRALFVHNAWIRDPYIVRGPDDFYYLTGTTPVEGDPREQSDPYNSGLGTESLVGWQANVWRSQDLVDWESLESPYTLKDGIWFAESPEAFEKTDLKQWRLWAPELHWIASKQKWALVHTSPSPVAGANLSLSAGPEVSGPWTNPMGASIQKKHDPSLFLDDDGTWWMIWGATTIAPLKPDFSGFAAKPTEIRPAPSSGDAMTGLKMGHEGCLVMKIEGKYVLFGTGWSTGKMRRGSYNLYYATADEITGPYSERKFAGRFLGHGTPFQDGEGRWWCTAFYNANVPPNPREGIETVDLSDTARTINQRGTTLVPLEVKLRKNGELFIRAKDPAYGTVGPDEAQNFSSGKGKRRKAKVQKKPSAEEGNPYVKTVPGRWSKEKAWEWYKDLPWLVGCNYYPANAINQIDMWQASTWDPETITKELALAESIGMNTLRVYLHDLVWGDDEKGLYERMDQFLDICKSHGIRPSFVFFDDCHYPDPKLGPQPLPVKGWHNSGWLNCPARDLARRFAAKETTPEEEAHLKNYVQRTMRQFDGDERVLYWELYNEPGRGNGANGDMGSTGGAANQQASIGDDSNRLVYESWVWAREVAPSQPITSCTLGSLGAGNIAINQANADILSIHSYAPPKRFEELIVREKAHGRPVIMTEWLARTNQNTVEDCLPILKKHGVGAIHWGFVMGESGTIWPWSSRVDPETKTPLNLNAKREAGEVVKPGGTYPEPEVWFHDLFRPDHSPYDPSEVALFKKLTGVDG